MHMHFIGLISTNQVAGAQASIHQASIIEKEILIINVMEVRN